MTSELPLAAEYVLCALDAKGRGSAMVLGWFDRQPVVGTMLAGLVELALAGVVSLGDLDVTVVGDLPESMAHLRPLYDEIAAEQSVSVYDLAQRYLGKENAERINALLEPLTDALEEAGVVESKEFGSYDGKTAWKARPGVMDTIMGEIRASLLEEDGKTSEQADALAVLLCETALLKLYVPQHELEEMSEKLGLHPTYMLTAACEPARNAPETARKVESMRFVGGMIAISPYV